MKGVNTFHRLGGSRQVTPAQQGHESGTNVCSRGHQAQPRTAPAGHLPAPPRASRTPAPGLREASCPRALSAAEGWDPRGPGRNEQGIREAGPYWKRFLSRPGRPAGRRQPALRREAGGVAGMVRSPRNLTPCPHSSPCTKSSVLGVGQPPKSPDGCRSRLPRARSPPHQAPVIPPHLWSSRFGPRDPPPAGEPPKPAPRRAKPKRGTFS
ncbi:basic proline-rich protein-like isoform X1 [Suricata suricatta]|uniref:basic proline-rich protein-like isoform X1 n=1 Tax=Suricata suricatta TaxID=37032 RepID=UPI0011558A82|nr:basic proline-rich protein-like isoform X1 [Suricata suricatta]XP_029784381.1 basic proline-rich protein-like isoform X1 [Suricata suricatta]XP_029784382.1 basic proline-rich protein-like isoform X1 [Suricata suricatta]XP_029784383.1 basic proline-rich protein-like isoform X1 [Suricata suricatta]